MIRLGAMRAAALTGLLAAALLGQSPALSAPGARSRVSLDWRNVRDADIERCGLSRLRAGTLERLVEDGHAVVDASDATIRVRVSSVPGGLEIRVESSESSRKDSVRLPEGCDATLVLEAISRIADLVGQVSAVSKVAPPAAPAPAEQVTATEPQTRAEPETGAFQLSLDLAAKAGNPRDFLLFGGGVGADFGVLRDWQLGGRAELLGNRRDSVTVLEASTALTAGWQPASSALGVQLELGPILHLGSSERLTASEFDAAGGAGIKLRAGILRGQLIGYLRLRRFEHYIDGRTAFDTGHFGLILRIGAQLFDS